MNKSCQRQRAYRARARSVSQDRQTALFPLMQLCLLLMLMVGLSFSPLLTGAANAQEPTPTIPPTPTLAPTPTIPPTPTLAPTPTNTPVPPTPTNTPTPAPPDTTILSGPALATESTSATFTFASNYATATFECALDAASFTACTSPITYNGLASGPHEFLVRAIDATLGPDLSPADYEWEIGNTTAPITTITAHPDAVTESRSATFAFVADVAGATFSCVLDGVGTDPCISPITYNDLALGGHLFTVEATTEFQITDTIPVTFAWTIIDITAPETTINSGPPVTTTEQTATFTFSANEAGATFQCALDAAAFAPCTSPLQLTGLAVGAHTLAVRAIDPAGNMDGSPATHTWTVQTPAVCPLSTVVYSANADAWIQQGSPNDNKGTDADLKVKSQGTANFRTLVRFTQPNTVPAGCTVQSATLRLFASASSANRTLQALQLASSWVENTVNWNNQPATVGAAATTASGNGYREWNVTAQVQAMFAAGANHGFLLRDETEGGTGSEQKFHSKEKGSTLPELVIQYQ